MEVQTIRQYKPRDKITQKMTRDGLIEINETKETEQRISRREQDADFSRPQEQPTGRNRQRMKPPEQTAAAQTPERTEPVQEATPQAAQDAAQLQGVPSRFRLRRSFPTDRTREPPSASWSVWARRTPTNRPKRQHSGRSAKLPQKRNLPAYSLPRKNYLPQSLKNM